jgi:glycogen phosphorylase
MSEKESAAIRAATTPNGLAALRRQYGCGLVELTGSANALYERHLLFDNVADPATAGARERYEGLARSVRDVLSTGEVEG